MKSFKIYLLALLSLGSTQLMGQYQFEGNPVKLPGLTQSGSTQFSSYEINLLYNLGGQVFVNSLPLDVGAANLILYDNGQYSQQGSMVFDTLGYYYFLNEPEGTYYVQVQAEVSSSFHGLVAPTYYGGSLNWSESSPINLTNSFYTADIQLVSIPGPQAGQGTISGTIFDGNKEYPLPGVEVLLYDNNYNVLTFTKTDISGSFSFHNLAFGSYIIYPEICGLLTFPVSVSLSAANPFTGNIIFTVDNNSVSGMFGNPSENDLLVKAEIFPNPALDQTRISFSSIMPTDLTMKITDGMGREIEVHQYDNIMSEMMILDLTGFSHGIYYIYFSGPQFKFIKKLIKV